MLKLAFPALVAFVIAGLLGRSTGIAGGGTAYNGALLWGIVAAVLTTLFLLARGRRGGWGFAVVGVIIGFAWGATKGIGFGHTAVSGAVPFAMVFGLAGLWIGRLCAQPEAYRTPVAKTATPEELQAALARLQQAPSKGSAVPRAKHPLRNRGKPIQAR